jgi:hypothetical protein
MTMSHKPNPANFMQCLAPTNIQGTELESTDQCAMAIRFKQQDECRQAQKGNLHPASVGADYRDWMMEHRILERGMQAKTHRGGMNMRAEDGLVNPPRGNYPETMRDTGTAAERLLIRDLHSK